MIAALLFLVLALIATTASAALPDASCLTHVGMSKTDCDAVRGGGGSPRVTKGETRLTPR